MKLANSIQEHENNSVLRSSHSLLSKLFSEVSIFKVTKDIVDNLLNEHKERSVKIAL